MDKIINKPPSVEVSADIPDTLEKTIDPVWLSKVLASISGGNKVASIEVVNLVKAMAAKVLIAVSFEDKPEKKHHLCVKGFFDDMAGNSGGLTTLREADFYLKIAPHITMRTPPCPVVVADRDAMRCVFVMEDMIAAGAHFYSALEPLTVDQTAETLDQLARLHVASHLLPANNWIPCRIQDIAQASHRHLTPEQIQALMHDTRRSDLPDRTVDVNFLIKGIELLAKRHAKLPQTILHGDVHPGNVYRDADGGLGFTDWQLVQSGHWSLDVAYHIASVLPVEVAEKEERVLLNHYLDAVRRYGGDELNREDAWGEYRRAPIYGYYHWAITQRVYPPITHQAFKRLGASVTRHESYKLLGL